MTRNKTSKKTRRNRSGMNGANKGKQNFKTKG